MMVASGERAPRACNSDKRWAQLRSRRYAVLRDVGKVECREAARISTSPIRFAAKMRELGHDPEQWPELARENQSGWPRRVDPRALRNTRYYHELRAMGADSRFASEYSKGPGAFERGKRILRGEEIE